MWRRSTLRADSDACGCMHVATEQRPLSGRRCWKASKQGWRWKTQAKTEGYEQRGKPPREVTHLASEHFRTTAEEEGGRPDRRGLRCEKPIVGATVLVTGFTHQVFRATLQSSVTHMPTSRHFQNVRKTPNDILSSPRDKLRSNLGRFSIIHQCVTCSCLRLCAQKLDCVL